MAAVARRVEATEQDGGGTFLGVTASARGFRWRERLAPAQRNIALAISQRHGLPELLGRVLAARGIGIDEVPVVLDPTIKALMPDPSVMQGMETAAKRLADAVERREKVAVFGDYDVDGACSSALMSRWLSHHGVPSRIYIPDRIFEGYGPNPSAIESLVNEGAKLIVTVDCGTTSFEPLEHRPQAPRRRAGHRPPPGRRAAARRRCGGQSQPPGRHLRPRPPVRGRRDVHDARRGHPRDAAARRLRQGSRRAGAARAARSRGAGDGLRRGAAAGPQPRLRHARADRHAPAQQHRPARAVRRGRASTSRRRLIRWGSCSARASMPAAVSAMPRSARDC